jgi:hypothetical protein
MKASLGAVTPTAVGSTVSAHVGVMAPAPAAMHLMTAVEAGMQLPEHVFWETMNACGDAGAVLAVHDVLGAGQNSEHKRLQQVNGALAQGIVNVCGLRSGALTCVLWESLRCIRQDAELGRAVPHGLRVYCSKAQLTTLQAVCEAMDPPLQCTHVTPRASRPFLAIVPEDMMAWLTTPSTGEGADADEWAQSTSLPMRLAAVTGIATGRTQPSQAQLLLGEHLADLDSLAQRDEAAVDAAAELSQEQTATSAEYAQWHARFKKQTSYSRTRMQIDSVKAQAEASRRQAAKRREQAASRRQAGARDSIRPEDARMLGKLTSGDGGRRAWTGNALHMATARSLKKRQAVAQEALAARDDTQ